MSQLLAPGGQSIEHQLHHLPNLSFNLKTRLSQ